MVIVVGSVLHDGGFADAILLAGGGKVFGAAVVSGSFRFAYIESNTGFVVEAGTAFCIDDTRDFFFLNFVFWVNGFFAKRTTRAD